MEDGNRVPEDNNISLVEIPAYEEHRALILKWLKVLFVCEIVRVVMSVISFIPVLEGLDSLITSAISIVVIVAMFKLAVVNERYRKAGIFHCISIGGSVVLVLLHMEILSLAFVVLALIAVYHEFNAHSELTEPLDEKLSDRWHDLFGLRLAGGFVAGLFSMIPMMVASMLGMGEEMMDFLMSLIVMLVSMILKLLYVIYMKQTLKLFR